MLLQTELSYKYNAKTIKFLAGFFLEAWHVILKLFVELACENNKNRAEK